VEQGKKRNTFIRLRRANRHVCSLGCVFTQVQTKTFSEKRRILYHFGLYWCNLCEPEHMTNVNKRKYVGRMWKNEGLTVA